MKVVVTGANGFLGAQIVKALLKKGHHPVALVRSSSSRERLPAAVEIRDAHLDDDERLRKSLHGADAVVHAAGGGRSSGESMRARNVSLTERVVRAAKNGDMRLVFVSSLAAKGAVSDYGESKREAEAAVFKEDPEALILRPCAIYGPGDERWLQYFSSAKRGFAVAPKVAQLALIHVDDCAEALVMALEKNGRGVYDLCDGQTHNWRDVARVTSVVLQRRVRTLELSANVLRPIAVLSEAVAKARGVPAFLSRDKIKDAFGLRESDSTPARRDFGWSPRYDLQAGFRQTLEEEGLAP